MATRDSMRGSGGRRILAVTPDRIVVLDAGKLSLKKARGVVTDLVMVMEPARPGAWHPEALAELPSPWPREIPKTSLVPKAFTGDGRQKST